MLPVERQAAALCSPSPTGKHHWMIPGIGAEPVGICKYCAAERQFKGCGMYDWMDYGQTRERILEVVKRVGK
ncbi:hypothetical protein LCGC14_0964480 [marine sediment metagenome]|uniref:Uncharacterized protein n=1 Tax=marine sediment metagenome TaxID=412755 RepID=A0A0F9NZL5_9ZZZZ